MTSQDEQQLKIIEICYYVVGGMAGLFALIPILHVVIGILMLKGIIPIDDEGQQAPAFVGWLFIGIGSSLIFFGATLCLLMILNARFLAKRRRYSFCFIMSIISCLFMPLGTILGVLTIIVLSRPAVKTVFA